MNDGATHPGAAPDQVTNQPPLIEDHDAFAANPWLAAIVDRAGIGDMATAASALGRFVGSAEAEDHAALANRNPPELRTHDRFGNRMDEVDYHPSYHALMTRALGAGVHSIAWKRPIGGFSAHALLFYLWNQLEQGTACPVTMTFASIPIFTNAPAIESVWRPKVLADAYDPRPLPHTRKAGVTVGMAMTEKQGGSDLRSTQTLAVEDSDGSFRLTGHKWFCSAPMSDAFFTLARLPRGQPPRGQDQTDVTCFFVPRSLDDGTRNGFFIQRLKDKCGNRSNASSEIEYRDTRAWLVGERGRGISTLIEMAHHTRFDIVVGVAGMMRAALDSALHHARHREAFGKRLDAHPLMANVLADLVLETQAATLLSFRLALAFDRSAAGDAREAELQRILTPIAKYWLCKRVTPVALEAMECLGGNGYVEESGAARLYREAPLNGIWEGSANVICLDVLRALGRSRDAFSALADEIAAAGDPRIRQASERAAKSLADPATAEPGARSIVEALAICTQASLMKRYADPGAAEAFCASRLEASCGGRTLGTLAAGADFGAIIEGARLRM